MSECRTGCEGFCSVLAASTALVINSRRCTCCRGFQMFRCCDFLVVHMAVRNGDIDGCGDNSNLFGVTQFVSRQIAVLSKADRVTLNFGIAVDCALECHQFQLVGGRVRIRSTAVAVQNHGFFCPVYCVPFQRFLNAVCDFTAICNISQTTWNADLAFQSVHSAFLLHINGECDCVPTVCCCFVRFKDVDTT